MGEATDRRAVEWTRKTVQANGGAGYTVGNWLDEADAAVAYARAAASNLPAHLTARIPNMILDVETAKAGVLHSYAGLEKRDLDGTPVDVVVSGGSPFYDASVAALKDRIVALYAECWAGEEVRGTGPNAPPWNPFKSIGELFGWPLAIGLSAAVVVVVVVLVKTKGGA